MHGTAGPLPITVTSEETAYQKHVMKATEQFPKDFPYNPDYNAGVNLGIGMCFVLVEHILDTY
jgi:hypothetical protein